MEKGYTACITRPHPESKRRPDKKHSHCLNIQDNDCASSFLFLSDSALILRDDTYGADRYDRADDDVHERHNPRPNP